MPKKIKLTILYMFVGFGMVLLYENTKLNDAGHLQQFFYIALKLRSYHFWNTSNATLSFLVHLRLSVQDK